MQLFCLIYASNNLKKLTKTDQNIENCLLKKKDIIADVKQIN